ncbi:MAG: tetratricopeptide repeat protein [Terriglobia bacterium]
MLNRCDDLLRNHSVVAKWLLVLATVAAYGDMLGNGFVYDDGKQVLENPFVRNPRLWRRIFTGSVWSFQEAPSAGNFYRPLHIFSHWLVWRIAGPNPSVFHLYQLIFYVTAVLLVYRLGRELFANHLAAYAGALLWALHPLHVEPVCWIAGVPDVGCGLFFVLAFLLFLRAESAATGRWVRHTIAAGAFSVAVLFKETALSFPLLLGVYWFVLGKQESWWQRILRWLPYGIVAGVYLEIRVMILGHFSHAPHLWRVPPRVAEAAVGLLGQHAKLFFWPIPLSDFRVFELAPSLLSPWPWITLVVLALALLLRRRDPAPRFLILWWAVTLLPCLDVRQLSFPLLAERFSFLPSVGACLAVGWFLMEVLPEWIAARPPIRALIPALGLVLVLFAREDLQAIPRWRNNDALYDYSYRVSPKSAVVHVHRALDLQYRNGDLAGAAQEYETAMQLSRSSFVGLSEVTYDCQIGLGQIASSRGHGDEALAYFRKAVSINPNSSPAYDELGSLYFPRGDYARAAEYFQQSVRVNPLDFGGRFFLGSCLMKLGKPAQAAEQFHAAREADPDYVQAYQAEAQALEAAGDLAGAAKVRQLADKK